MHFLLFDLFQRENFSIVLLPQLVSIPTWEEPFSTRENSLSSSLSHYLYGGCLTSIKKHCIYSSASPKIQAQKQLICCIVQLNNEQPQEEDVEEIK